MKKLVIPLFVVSALAAGCSTVPYDQAVSGWDSHEDVANWLDDSFYFDKDRQKTIAKRLKSEGPEGLLVRNPEKLYSSRTGYCADSANFAQYHLNKIDPNYNARWVFVENAMGRPNHWVTAFEYQGKLYIMDYGAGPAWYSMNGTHGPYESLDGYREFLASLNLPGFEVGHVYFREMPGRED